ncbi:hypothetical protein ABGB14_13625 [Nonomuraea sp. B10E15]|uniref:hypothetical protein n=1 Tax=Nonomuraea sp. B10E15 TaxID=3153560 RepID=UPI00325F1123
MLDGSPGARDRVAEAQDIVAGNPVCAAIVERAEALLDGDREALLAGLGLARWLRHPR